MPKEWENVLLLSKFALVLRGLVECSFYVSKDKFFRDFASVLGI